MIEAARRELEEGNGCRGGTLRVIDVRELLVCEGGVLSYPTTTA